jgi:AcrR family transcriptional regulator
MARSTASLQPAPRDDAPRADGRTRLLDAAEVLMAEHGAFAVSLREINAAAGQRNGSGLQYHFGGREGLLQAVITRHMSVVDARRNAMVDAIEAEERGADVRALVRALVEPLAARLSSPSGRRYLLILMQLRAHVDADGEEWRFASANRSLVRVGKHFSRLAAGMPLRIVAARTGHVATFVLQALATRARKVETRRRAPLDHEVFVANLVDVLVAIATAPVSRETARLLRP